MVGSSRAFGAVAALQGYPNPVSVARAVLERLPQHCVLVGEGAATFAAESGFTTADLLTDESRRLFREALAEAEGNVEGERAEGSEGDRAYQAAALDLVRRFAPHDGPWGTINVLALDASGEMVVGVSTSGYPWKYPGRVGDSAAARGRQLVRPARRRRRVHRPRRAEHAGRHRPVRGRGAAPRRGRRGRPAARRSRTRRPCPTPSAPSCACWP